MEDTKVVTKKIQNIRDIPLGKYSVECIEETIGYCNRITYKLTILSVDGSEGIEYKIWSNSYINTYINKHIIPIRHNEELLKKKGKFIIEVIPTVYNGEECKTTRIPSYTNRIIMSDKTALKQ